MGNKPTVIKSKNDIIHDTIFRNKNLSGIVDIILDYDRDEKLYYFDDSKITFVNLRTKETTYLNFEHLIQENNFYVKVLNNYILLGYKTVFETEYAKEIHIFDTNLNKVSEIHSDKGFDFFDTLELDGIYFIEYREEDIQLTHFDSSDTKTFILPNDGNKICIFDNKLFFIGHERYVIFDTKTHIIESHPVPLGYDIGFDEGYFYRSSPTGDQILRQNYKTGKIEPYLKIEGRFLKIQNGTVFDSMGTLMKVSNRKSSFLVKKAWPFKVSSDGKFFTVKFVKRMLLSSENFNLEFDGPMYWSNFTFFNSKKETKLYLS